MRKHADDLDKESGAVQRRAIVITAVKWCENIFAGRQSLKERTGQGQRMLLRSFEAQPEFCFREREKNDTALGWNGEVESPPPAPRHAIIITSHTTTMPSSHHAILFHFHFISFFFISHHHHHHFHSSFIHSFHVKAILFIVIVNVISFHFIINHTSHHTHTNLQSHHINTKVIFISSHLCLSHVMSSLSHLMSLM